MTEKEWTAADMGRKGGKKRLESLTDEERSKIASKAAKTRWKKAKAAKRGKK
jgi:hypothetical protein